MRKINLLFRWLASEFEWRAAWFFTNANKNPNDAAEKALIIYQKSLELRKELFG
jgi:hypothetical protein